MQFSLRGASFIKIRVICHKRKHRSFNSGASFYLAHKHEIALPGRLPFRGASLQKRGALLLDIYKEMAIMWLTIVS